MSHSNNKEGFFERNKEIIILFIVFYFFFNETKPDNNNRVHWVGFYFLFLSVTGISNLLLWNFYSEEGVMLVFNIINGILFMTLLIKLIEIDLISIRDDRNKAKIKAKERNIQYLDPFAASSFRRVFILLLIAVPYWYWNNKQWNVAFNTILISTFFIVYSIRDTLYADKQSNISNKTKNASNQTTIDNSLKRAGE